MTTRSRMTSMARNSKTRLAKKQEIAEKVQEIQLRQKNWMKQRDDHLKNKSSTSEGNKKSADPKNRSASSQQRSKGKLDRNLTEEITESSTAQLHKERFKSWLAAREKNSRNQNPSNDHDPDVNVLHVSSSRPSGFASPDPGWNSGDHQEGYYEQTGQYSHHLTREHDEAVQNLMSHKDFDAMADSIVSRVKNNMNLRGSDNTVDTVASPVRKTQSFGKKYVEKKENYDTQLQGTGVSDLSSHYCHICQNLMLSSSHTPTIYIPCGHTICLSCAEGRQLCPTCKSEASSKTCNIMLLQIIQNYHKKTSLPGRSRTQNQQNMSSYSPDNYVKTGNESRAKYREEYGNLLTRHEILRTEHQGLQNSLKSITKQIAQEEKQILNVEKEEENVQSQIRLLEEKLRTLNLHKQHFEKDRDELKDKGDEAKNKLNMIQDTLLTLEIEMEKVKLLAEQ